ncbi:MAG: DivIVA domain-containing protein [Bacteroidia bacterium]|nr:DivIVA domain-containing protein [Bacteroidia bacterium]
MLTPIDIQNQTFNRTLRGYDPEEVRTFLRQVAQEWGSVLEEKHSLLQKVEQLSSELKRYKEMESLLQRTLLQAEENSRLTLQNAEKNANLILQEARQKAEETLAALNRQKEHIEQAIQHLQQRRQDILLELRSFLTLQLERLEQLAGNPTPVEKKNPTPPPSSSATSSPTISWAAKIADKL